MTQLQPHKGEIEERINTALELAYLAGRWHGQVDLEEHMENESYFDAFLSYAHAQKTGMPFHSVAIDDKLQTRPVRYNLRSDKWREGVKKSSREYLEKAKKILLK